MVQPLPAGSRATWQADHQINDLLTDENRARELAPLQKIKDNYPKFLLTMSPMAEGSIDGIIIKDFIKFLLAFD